MPRCALAWNYSLLPSRTAIHKNQILTLISNVTCPQNAPQKGSCDACLEYLLASQSQGQTSNSVRQGEI